jgi:hypothetical protein
MRDTLSGEPRPSPCTGQQINRSLLKDASPDTGQYIIPGLSFENNIVDPCTIKQTSKQ